MKKFHLLFSVSFVKKILIAFLFAVVSLLTLSVSYASIPDPTTFTITFMNESDSSEYVWMSGSIPAVVYYPPGMDDILPSHRTRVYRFYLNREGGIFPRYDFSGMWLAIMNESSKEQTIWNGYVLAENNPMGYFLKFHDFSISPISKGYLCTQVIPEDNNITFLTKDCLR